MSSAPFPASSVLQACRDAGAEVRTRSQSEPPGAGDALARIGVLQTLAEKVIEHANQDLHATVSVSADDLALIARHLKFDGPPPLAALTG